MSIRPHTPLQIQVTVERYDDDHHLTVSHRSSPLTSPSSAGIQDLQSYRLTQTSRTEMVLRPSRSALIDDTTSPSPAYHIAIEANVFFPLCTTTIVRRGHASGEYVGEFTAGSYEQATVTLGRARLPLKDVFNHKVNWGLMEKVCDWQFFRTYKLRWRRLEDVYIPERGIKVEWDCLLLEDGASKGERIASFEPEILPNPLVLSKRRHLPRLRIRGDGQMLFDEIMMSALLLQRARLKMLETKPSQLSY